MLAIHYMFLRYHGEDNDALVLRRERRGMLLFLLTQCSMHPSLKGYISFQQFSFSQIAVSLQFGEGEGERMLTPETRPVGPLGYLTGITVNQKLIGGLTTAGIDFKFFRRTTRTASLNKQDSRSRGGVGCYSPLPQKSFRYKVFSKGLHQRSFA